MLGQIGGERRGRIRAPGRCRCCSCGARLFGQGHRLGRGLARGGVGLPGAVRTHGADLLVRVVVRVGHDEHFPERPLRGCPVVGHGVRVVVAGASERASAAGRDRAVGKEGADTARRALTERASDGCRRAKVVERALGGGADPGKKCGSAGREGVVLQARKVKTEEGQAVASVRRVQSSMGPWAVPPPRRGALCSRKPLPTASAWPTLFHSVSILPFHSALHPPSDLTCGQQRAPFLPSLKGLLRQPSVWCSLGILYTPI
jgi:hypothetical protein